MANNTWFGATNEVLELGQLDPIATTTLFDNPTLNLTKYQRAARAYIRLAHMHLSVKAYKHFATRRIQLNIDSSSAIWSLDMGINPEHIKPRTFFNVSTGTIAAQNREIRNQPYNEFKDLWPDLSKITSGPPERWILMPIDRTNISPVHTIRIYPNPDQPYQLEYQATLNAYPLKLSTDIILWPPEYEYALWEFAWDLLERGLGEGKEGRIAQMAEAAANEVRLVAGRPADVRRSLRVMRMPRAPWFRRGWYNSPASLDSNG